MSGRRFSVQIYCGQEERQVPPALSAGGLDGSLPQISACLGNLGIPSALSRLTPVLSSLLSAVELRTKNGFPGHEALRGFTKGKRIEFYKLIKHRIMRVRRMTIEQGRRVGIDRFPNFHRTGSVRGMKRLYYGKDCLLIRCGSYVYNVSSEPKIYYQASV